MSKPKPQYIPPPDPKVVAEAQTGSNVNSAIASGVIGNVNQVGPHGSTTYNQSDTYTMTGPNGEKYQVPRYTQTTTLSPEQQQLYNQQTQLGGKMNNLAIGQVDRLGSVLGKPVDFQSVDRGRVEQAMFDRLNPQLERDRAGLETTLVNQGFQRGTEGFNNEMDSHGRQVNDQRLAITAQGGQEQQRELQQMLALRNQPINEISALMSGGQVSLPQANGYNAPQIGAANVGDYMYNTAAMNNQKYQSDLQAKTAQQNAIFGALGGVAGAGLYGGMGGKLGGLFGKG